MKWPIQNPYDNPPDLTLASMTYNNVLVTPILPTDFLTTGLYLPESYGTIGDNFQKAKASALFHVSSVGPDVKTVKVGDYVVIDPVAMSPVMAGDVGFICEDIDIKLVMTPDQLARAQASQRSKQIELNLREMEARDEVRRKHEADAAAGIRDVVLL